MSAKAFLQDVPNLDLGFEVMAQLNVDLQTFFAVLNMVITKISMPFLTKTEVLGKHFCRHGIKVILNALIKPVTKPGQVIFDLLVVTSDEVPIRI